MARLILSLDGQVLAEYNMTKERYTIGRLPDNDVRIDNVAVSGHHALIINIITAPTGPTSTGSGSRAVGALCSPPATPSASVPPGVPSSSSVRSRLEYGSVSSARGE